MKFSTKIIAAAAAIIALSAGGLAIAHQAEGHGGCGQGMRGGHGEGMRGAQSPADVAARLATLKTELKITPAQEAAWQKFEGVATQQAQVHQAQRSALQAQMQAASGVANTDRTAQREAMMKQHDSDRTARDAARQELFSVLTPEQKTLAEQKMRDGRGRGHGEGHRGGMQHQEG
jgi:periplasmic protein CpxP/Spy